MRNGLGNQNRGALSGLQVIEIGNNIAVAYCCKLMADLGAVVLKVENPQTANLERQEDSLSHDNESSEKRGFLFAYVNSNKYGITLNLESELGQRILYDLAKDIDILIEGNSPRRAKELGLSYDYLRQVNNMLVMTSITPFGQTGPYQEYKAYAINCSAASASNKTLGAAGREPLSPPLSQPHFQSGCMAATATLGAILAREFVGQGQHIDISEVEVWLTHHTGYGITGYVFRGEKRIRSGRGIQALYPNGILRCKDGDVHLLAITGHQWRNFLEMVGDGDIPSWYTSDPKFTTTDFRVLNLKYGDELWTRIEPWLMQHTKQEIFSLARERGIALAPIQTVNELLDNSHLNTREYFVELDDPQFGKLRFPGPPYRFSKTPIRIQHSAPTLGQHNGEIYCGHLGYSKEYLSQLRGQGVI